MGVRVQLKLLGVLCYMGMFAGTKALDGGSDVVILAVAITEVRLSLSVSVL